MSELRDNVEAGQFEMDEAGETVFARYRRAPDRLVVTWVEAPAALRGSGAAGRLMTLLAEYARENGLGITPVCGYAAGWLRGSKTYRDLIV